MLEIVDVYRNGSAREITAQVFGVLALLFSVLSFQCRTYKKIMISQLLCASFFVIHFGMLFSLGHRNAISGCAANAVCVVRNTVYWIMSSREEKHPKIKVVLFTIATAAVCLIFYQSPVTLLCTAGMILNTLAFSEEEPQKVRKLILCSSPFICIYNFLCASIGGFVNELISMASVIIGLIRFSKTRKA